MQVLVIGITIGLIFVAPIVIKFLDRKELQEIETKIEPTMRDMFRDMDDTYITGVFLTKYLAGSKNAEQITGTGKEIDSERVTGRSTRKYRSD